MDGAGMIAATGAMQTPLDIAEQAGRSWFVAWLLEMGATRRRKSA